VPAIRIEGLTKRFADVQALDRLSLAVEPGSVFGFLGPNGAGKTTTIRILTGLARADAGRAWIDGLEVTRDPRGVGRPAAERDQRIAELLDLTGLAEAAGRRIGGYSGGMGQRLGIAQALVNRPPVLLLDEPVSGLDPAGRRELLQLIERLRGQCTVFMSTHILADVERVCDAVGIVSRGRLVAEAPQQELLDRYVVPAFELEVDNRFTAQLSAWAGGIQAQPWVTSVQLDRSTARVVVSDIEISRRELLASALAAGLLLNRYEMVRPSLEDVFLRLVEGGGTP
jgi:ABC-2 type transport system ATP-binding protein